MKSLKDGFFVIVDYFGKGIISKIKFDGIVGNGNIFLGSGFWGVSFFVFVLIFYIYYWWLYRFGRELCNIDDFWDWYVFYYYYYF